MSLDFKKEQAITLSEVPHYVSKRRGKKVRTRPLKKSLVF